MKTRGISASLVLVTATMLLSPWSHAVAQPGTKVFQALLEGFQETPAISTNGTGAFRATLNTAGTELRARSCPSRDWTRRVERCTLNAVQVPTNAFIHFDYMRGN